jgi:hypothetical protein
MRRKRHLALEPAAACDTLQPGRACRRRLRQRRQLPRLAARRRVL